MTDYEQLLARLREQPYLVATMDGDVRLTTQPAILRLLVESGDFPSACVINAYEALRRFARLRGIGENRTFGSKDVAAIAGMSYMSLYEAVRGGVFTPSIRPFHGSGQGHEGEARFSWCDAFCAGLIGSLRRHRIPMDVCRRIQPLMQSNLAITGRHKATLTP